MFDKLEDLLIRFEEIMGELQEPDVANDQADEGAGRSDTYRRSIYRI